MQSAKCTYFRSTKLNFRPTTLIACIRAFIKIELRTFRMGNFFFLSLTRISFDPPVNNGFREIASMVRTCLARVQIICLNNLLANGPANGFNLIKIGIQLWTASRFRRGHWVSSVRLNGSVFGGSRISDPSRGDSVGCFLCGQDSVFCAVHRLKVTGTTQLWFVNYSFRSEGSVKF